MPAVKKIWRDNTMPPTNYIWMKTNLKNELVGIYEWYNGKWHEVSLNSDFYTKQEVDNLLQHVEQDIIDKLTTGDYEININVTIDDALSLESENAVQNKVVSQALLKKLDKEEFYESSIEKEDYPWYNY